MSINPVRIVSFKSQIVPNEYFKKAFDEVLSNYNPNNYNNYAPTTDEECRNFTRTLDAILNDGKDDVIEFGVGGWGDHLEYSRLIPSRPYNFAEVNKELVTTTPYLFHKSGGHHKEIMGIVKNLGRIRNVASPNTLSDYEKESANAVFENLKNIVNNEKLDLSIFDNVQEFQKKLVRELAKVNLKKLEELRTKIFGE